MKPAISLHTGSNILYGLIEEINMLREEGLGIVYARHGAATWAALRAWGLEVLCNRQGQKSGVLTAVMMPKGHSADAFRIGHLGDFNNCMLMMTLSGVELGLSAAEVPFQSGGTQAALRYLSERKTSYTQKIDLEAGCIPRQIYSCRGGMS